MLQAPRFEAVGLARSGAVARPRRARASRVLDRRATYLAHEVAEVGLRLRRATAFVESRLGWPALLSSGEPSLRELPVRGPLPEVGWLPFFADLEIEDGGGPIDVAGNEPDSVLLLHLAYDESLDFEFLDGGAIQFRIPQQALAAGDWSKVIAEAESC